MNDSRHCRTCGDTFEACACPSVVMTIADADAANTEIDTLRSRIASLEAERDTLRARVEIAERIIPIAESYRVALQGIKDSDHSPRCRWKRQHAGRTIRVDCDCHCMLAHRALDTTR